MDSLTPQEAEPPKHQAPGEGRSFAGNASWLIAAQVVSKFASFAFVVIVAQGLEPVSYGYFNFAISFTPIFLMFGTWGLNLAMVREVARSPERFPQLLASGLALRVALGGAGLLLALAVSPLLVDDSGIFLAIGIIGSALFVDELADFFGAAFVAFEKMRGHALIILTNRFLTTAIAAVVVVAGGDLLQVAFAYLAGSCGALIFAWVSVRRKLPRSALRDFESGVTKELLRKGAPLGLAAFLNMLVFRLDAVLLLVMKGPVAVAMYGIAYRFFESFLFVAWSLANAALPRMSRSTEPKDSVATYEMTMTVMLALYLPLAVGAPFAARGVVEVIFGERYLPAADAVAWLTAAAVLYGIAHLSRIALLGVGKRKAIPIVAGIVLMVNLTANLLVIPRYGFVGAAATTFGSELVEASLLAGFYRRVTGAGWPSPWLLIPILAAAVMGVTLWLTGARGFTAVALGTAVYLPSLIALASWLAPGPARDALALVRRK